MFAVQRSGPAELNHNHPALPAGYAEPVTPEVTSSARSGWFSFFGWGVTPSVETRSRSGDWIHRLPAPGSHPKQASFIPVAARKVNEIPVDRPAFEHQVPSPRNIEDLELVGDKVLTGTLQEASASLAWYAQEMDRRQQAEEKGDEYTLPALGPTLTNMRLFIQHLLNDRHFPQPLNDGERRALQKLDNQAAFLLDKGVPYKRTVLLGLVFVTLYDLLVQQRVLEPLVQQQPALLQKRYDLPTLWAFRFYTDPLDVNQPPQPVASIDPEKLVSCYGEGLNPEPPDIKAHLLAHHGCELAMNYLPLLLSEQAVLLYPSWEPLDIDAFCRFGHLPVYPLGLIAAYAANADGSMHSPLQFMVHDLFHIHDTGSFLYIKGTRPLDNPANRCAFRQLVQNRLPQSLAHLGIAKATHLLVFHLLHEQSTNAATKKLESESFVPLMWIQAEARREHWCDYSPKFQGIKDDEGTIAALWIHRLYAHWKAADLQLTDAHIDLIARHFLSWELPQLRWHLAYLDRHKTALRELFLSEAWDDILEQADAWTGNRRFCCTRGTFCKEDFFHWQEPHGGCCVDHSDVVYFDRLHQDGGAEQMAQATGVPMVYTMAF